MKSFRIKNIKSFVDSGDIQLAHITIFVGKNSSGKSSLVRFPAVLAQSFLEDSESPISFLGKFLDYGNYEDVVHNHTDSDITYTVEFDNNISKVRIHPSYRRSFSYRNSDLTIKNCKLSVTIGKAGKKIIIKRMVLFLDGIHAYEIIKENGKDILNLFCLFDGTNFNNIDEHYSFITNNFNGYTYRNILPSFHVSQNQIAKVVDRHFIAKGEKKTKKYKEYNQYPPNSAKNKYSNDADIVANQIECTLDLLQSVTFQIERTMVIEASSLSYIGPFRQNPERYYRDMERNARLVGARGENVSTMLINDYHKNNHLIETVSEWLYHALGYKLAIKDMGSNLFQVMIEDNKGFQSNIMDVGYGVPQVLPIVVAVFQGLQEKIKVGRNEGILIIEQPELHLHPAAQAELASLFAECVLNPNFKINRKLIIETHSEHLIRKLQVLIARNILSSDMVRIYYVDKNDDGSASVRDMKILPNGKFIDRWPSGFFDKAQELSMELLSASALKIGGE